MIDEIQVLAPHDRNHGPSAADSPPELQYTFIEQALRGGSSVALRCVAAASPPPRVTWLLDGQPLERYLPRHRYRAHHRAPPHRHAAR